MDLITTIGVCFFALLISAAVVSTMRRSYRTQGFEFSADCPEHVKLRTVKTLYPKMLDGERLVIPLCDQPFVSVMETTMKGWDLPFVGFVPDHRVDEFLSRAVRALALRKK